MRCKFDGAHMGHYLTLVGGMAVRKCSHCGRFADEDGNSMTGSAVQFRTGFNQSRGRYDDPRTSTYTLVQEPTWHFNDSAAKAVAAVNQAERARAGLSRVA